MNIGDFSEAELWEALAAADRRMRLPFGMIVLGHSIAAIAPRRGVESRGLGDAAHALTVSAVVFLLGQMMAALSILQARQNAANARMLRCAGAAGGEDWIPLSSPIPGTSGSCCARRPVLDFPVATVSPNWRTV